MLQRFTTRNNELVFFARAQGYQPEELVAMIEAPT
jgi:hypothetical protein